MSFFGFIIRWLAEWCSRVLTRAVEGLYQIYKVPIFMWTILASCITVAFRWVGSTIFGLISSAISSFLSSLSLTTPGFLDPSPFASFIIRCFALDNFTSLLLIYFGILIVAKQMHFVGFVIKQVMRIIP